MADSRGDRHHGPSSSSSLLSSSRVSGITNSINPEQIATQWFNKAKSFFTEIKAKISGEQIVTFDEAVRVLRDELHYPDDRALNFVKRFDRNNDGYLSATEFNNFRRIVQETKCQLVPKFKQYDLYGNGYITLEEASSILQNAPFNFPSGKVLFLLKNFDRDGNGRLDIEEFAGFYAEAKVINEDIASCFDRLDTDGNGVLSPDEVVSIIEDRLGFDSATARQLVEMFDQNQDGSLDKTEFMQLWTSMFGQ